MIATDAVLMADRAATGQDGVACSGLQAAPPLQRRIGVRAPAEDVRRVEARPGGVDVRQVAERVDALALLVEPVAERASDRRGEVGEAGPRRRRLEGVDRVAERPQRIAQVRPAEAPTEPLAVDGAADAQPA